MLEAYRIGTACKAANGIILAIASFPVTANAWPLRAVPTLIAESIPDMRMRASAVDTIGIEDAAEGDGESLVGTWRQQLRARNRLFGGKPAPASRWYRRLEADAKMTQVVAFARDRYPLQCVVERNR